MNRIKTSKIATLTLGCKVNQYETDAIYELLTKAGYEMVEFSEGADVYIVNTCSVTNMADRKSRQMLHRAKKMNPNAVIVAMGCYVQAAKEELLKDPYVDLVIGNNKKKDIVAILKAYEIDQEKRQEMIDIDLTREYEDLSIEQVSEHTRAYIKVQDGCNQFCSYCIIPYTRGRARSRAKEEVVKEVQGLAEHGYKEIVLTGIHLSSYGIDLADTSLLDLIATLSEVEGISRIRLGSLEPRIITEEFAAALSENPKVCPHFHLSLQSGCNATLKRMNRKYTTEEYEEKCTLLRKYFDKPALTTDVIVGFPGETEEEFEQTRAYLERINLYEMHIFKYSVRKGTKAADMPEQVPDPVKTERSNVLLSMTARHQQEFESILTNQEMDMLTEERIQIDGKYYITGHTRRYQKVAVPVETGRFADQSIEINQEVPIVITGKRKDKILLGALKY